MYGKDITHGILAECDSVFEDPEGRPAQLHNLKFTLVSLLAGTILIAAA